MSTSIERKEHWEKIYQTKDHSQMSWYQDTPATSLAYVIKLNLRPTARIFDNGAGDSQFVDHLLRLGYRNITLQDISATALEKTQLRLGYTAKKLRWMVCDEAACNPQGQYDLWHDRAAFHFLTEEADILSYVNTLNRCISPGGYLIIATFSDKGPHTCSGLSVKQYTQTAMEQLLRKGFEKIECKTEDHVTPFDTKQNFLYCVFRRRNF